KVLIVAGGNPDQTVAAAQTIATQSSVLSGAQSEIQSLNLPVKRQPDDAPRWARTDQRIVLGDYAPAEQLQGDGSGPLNVYFRIPPDLYYADGPNALLRVGYRYNPVPIVPISSMQVRINNAFLGSVPLTPGQQSSSQKQTDLPLPVVDLRPFSNSLSFDFTFQLLKKGGCNDTTPINMQGAILRDSYLDLRHNPHYAPMPNLEIFSNAGFPFTRFADLSETTVVLPPTPSAQEIETFVTLMGHFGRQTGYPALRVTVAGPDALHDGAQADFLLIGTGDDQPGFDKLANALPVTLRGGRVQVRDTEGFFAPLHHAWWKANGNEHTESGDLTAEGVPDAVIEGAESPFAPGANRSVVAIHLMDASSFEPFMSIFLQVQQSSAIAGSVAVLHGGQFASFALGTGVYHVGELPWWTWLQLKFVEVPWLVAVAILILAFLLAIWVRQWLRNRARARLNMLKY
ncbi:MAG TPA: cellulose biosynthesis cyclic di-GMP-binding regulatory protein BcsB, partial [Terracidiphilus sp.]|nr:cellulose biosynthesis cyclic di-GMP-binding regulatory protein BcsB [Terracidiphilus sp.]